MNSLFTILASICLNNAIILLENCPLQYLSTPKSPIGVSAITGTNQYALFATEAHINTTNCCNIDIYSYKTNSWSTTTLPEARTNLASTSWNNLVMFAGGNPQKGMNKSNRVDIYDVTTGQWNLKYLSEGRDLVAAVTLNNITMFGGGDGSGGESSIVDVWNHTTNHWSVMNLSQPRKGLMAASAGNKILFAGGQAPNENYTRVVDLYDTITLTWSIARLIEGRKYSGATHATMDVALFGGGFAPDVSDNRANAVDIYNDTSGKWSVQYLSQNRSGLVATNVMNRYAVFAGGNAQNSSGVFQSSRVDVYDGITNTWNQTEMIIGETGCGIAGVGSVFMIGGGATPLTNVTNVVAINSGCGQFNKTIQ
eukprot:68262_1